MILTKRQFVSIGEMITGEFLAPLGITQGEPASAKQRFMGFPVIIQTEMEKSLRFPQLRKLRITKSRSVGDDDFQL